MQDLFPLLYIDTRLSAERTLNEWKSEMIFPPLTCVPDYCFPHCSLSSRTEMGRFQCVHFFSGVGTRSAIKPRRTILKLFQKEKNAKTLSFPLRRLNEALKWRRV